MDTLTLKNQHILRGMVLVSITVLMFAVLDTISKYLTRYYSVTTILWFRYLLHTLTVVTWALPRLGSKLIRTRHPWTQILRGSLLPCTSVLFVLAMKYLPIAEATAISFMTPLAVTLLAVVFLNERVGMRHWLAIAVGFLGVIVIIRPGSGIFSWASLLPLGSSCAMASYQILTRWIAGRENLYTSSFYPGLVGLVAFSVFFLYGGNMPDNPWHIALLILVGVLGGLSHLILIQAFHHAPASQLAPFTYTQLIWVTIGGFVVFGDLPDVWVLVGIAMLASSGLYLVTQHRRMAGQRHT